MDTILKPIGEKIRTFRKRRGLTIQQLADALSKSKATVSKYESGDIAIDVVTLYQIAEILKVHVDQLLYTPPALKRLDHYDATPPFFKHVTKIYIYSFNGRTNQLLRGIIDISTYINANTYRAMMYLDIKDWEKYQYCQSTYSGQLQHFNLLSRFEFHNQDSDSELAVINIINGFSDAPAKWALLSTISSSPLLPCASKILLSKKHLPENDDLIEALKITKEDIRLIKAYNMFVVSS